MKFKFQGMSFRCHYAIYIYQDKLNIDGGQISIAQREFVWSIVSLTFEDSQLILEENRLIRKIHDLNMLEMLNENLC